MDVADQGVARYRGIVVVAALENLTDGPSRVVVCHTPSNSVDSVWNIKAPPCLRAAFSTVHISHCVRDHRFVLDSIL
jgi:hypothetical protein